MTNAEAIKMIQNDMKLHHDYLSGEYRKALKKAIKALKSQEWIPCSERLPVRGKDVLVTRKYYGSDDGNRDSLYVEISALFTDGDADEWHWFSDEYKMHPRNHKAIAWMPLPDPYRGGVQNE